MLCSTTARILLTLVLETQAELGVAPFHHVNVDSTRQSALPVYQALSTPGFKGLVYRVGAPYDKRASPSPYTAWAASSQSEAAQQSEAWQEVQRESSSSHVNIQAESTAEAKEGTGDAVTNTGEVAAPMLLEGTNIYGEKLEKCGFVEEESCGNDGDSLKICAALVPRVGQGQKNKYWLKAEQEHNLWIIEQFAKCISIWDLGSSSFLRGVTYGNNDLVVKCDALPSDVLQSQFTLDTFRECELEAHEYASATSSQRCKKFHRAIDNICTTCSTQSLKVSAKDTLAGMCGAITTTEAFAKTSPDFLRTFKAIESFTLSISILALMGFFLSSALTFGAVRCWRSTRKAAPEPLLGSSC